MLLVAATLFTGVQAVADEHARVTWSAAGLPPTYVARVWTAEVPAELRAEFAELLAATKFFALPSHLGLAPQARDAGSYAITVELGSQRHAVAFSDTSVTPELANLRAWIERKLLPVAR